MKRMILALVALAVFAAPLRAAEVVVDGLKVHYNAQGAGPAILFVHGWTCDETSWQFQVPAFAANHRVITIDLPGHGKSQLPANGKFSMALFAKAVEAVRANAGAERIVLVGHSMGGPVIRRYALDYPAHVAGLVAVDGQLDVRALSGNGIAPFPINRQMRENLIGNMFVASTPAALRTGITKMMLDTSEVTAQGAMGAMFDSANQSDKQITAPALSIYAGNAKDPATKEMLPKWEATAIAGAGHFLMMEKPAEFNRLLAGFLKDRAAY